MKKFFLGTVQLGMPYGINRQEEPHLEKSVRMLEFAYDSGVRYLDTASAYGFSLESIGTFHKRNPQKKFNVYSKFLYDENLSSLNQIANEQSKKLNISNLGCLYYHHFSDYIKLRNNEKFTETETKIGVSIYDHQDIDSFINDVNIQVVQLPLSVFHHHSLLKERVEQLPSGKEVLVRSIFLQGLLFTPLSKLTGILKAFVPTRIFLENIANELQLTMEDLAYSYAQSFDRVDGVIIGCENESQLKQNLNINNTEQKDWNYILKKMPKIRDDLLNPGNWK